MSIIGLIVVIVLIIYAFSLALSGIESIDNMDFGDIPKWLEQTLKFILKIGWGMLIGVGTFILTVIILVLTGSSNKDGKN